MLQIFKHAGSKVNLFNLCQLHISYAIYVKLLRSLIKEKVCHYLPGNMWTRGYKEKVTNSDIGRMGV